MDSSKREDTKKEYEATEWIRANVELTESDPVASLYDRMESQSGEQLAVVYAPFDGRQGPHFCDYGRILDFAVACGTAAVGCDIADARILDFGPGDGWPALLIAPMVSEVVGVEGSKRRVEVCARNAERLGIENARFVHVPPGNPLPFDDNSFDGVTAASSVEQTPDPRSTLKELYRVLKPGGALRMFYESLARYRGGHEHDIWFGDLDGAGYLLVFVRDIDGEMVRHYALVFDCPKSKIEDIFARAGVEPSYAALTPEILGGLCQRLHDATTWTTRHASCRTHLKWLDEIGFSSARPTHNGGWFAAQLFNRLAESERPKTLDAVDALLRPLVEIVVQMEAPASSRTDDWDPWITAVK